MLVFEMVHGGIMGTRSIKHSNLRVTCRCCMKQLLNGFPTIVGRNNVWSFIAGSYSLVFSLYLQSGCISKDSASKSMGEPQPVVSKPQVPQLQTYDLGFLEISQWKFNLLETCCILSSPEGALPPRLLL